MSRGFKNKVTVLRDCKSYFEKIGSNSAVCMGNFDGVHLGHVKLIETLISIAKKEGVLSLVLTFEPHSREVITGKKVKRLTPAEEKVNLIKTLSPDVVVVQTFSRELASYKAERFFVEILVGMLKASVIVLGPDSKFGMGGEGDRNLLEQLGSKYAVKVIDVPPFKIDDVIVSSSIIKDLLFAGKVSEVPKFLGRYYQISGKVIRGTGTGTNMGYPTANLEPDEILLPLEGVYAGAGCVEDKVYPAAIHIGERKTFKGSFTVEVHLIGREKSTPLYGETLKISFFERLRDIKCFENMEQLKSSIENDVKLASNLFLSIVKKDYTSLKIL